MKLLIFDTETTGLPKTREGPTYGPNNWPHLVSISWLILDTETNATLKVRNYIIKPQGWEIPEDSTRIHGIDIEMANEAGKDLREVIVEFLDEQYDALVAHNLEFDISVVVNAVLWDLKLQFPPIRGKRFCTMNISRSICKLPGNYGKYKSPKLKELYFCAFGKYPDENQLHNSLYDVVVLTDVIKNYLPLRQAMGLVASSVTNVSNVLHI